MRAFKFTFLVCVCFTIAPLILAQTPGPEGNYPGGERVIDRELRAYNDSIRRALDPSLGGVRREPRVIKSGPLALSATDIQAHKQFLSLKNTGLLRLVPRGRPDIKLRGSGSFYSFFYQSHEYGFGSDIGLEMGLIKTGFAGADFGILANIDDVPLEDLTLQDNRVSYLASYKPPAREQDARTEFKNATRGFTKDGMLYGRIALPEVDSTYLLRSIVYNRSDVLVAFRVVRIDSDDSVIIAWRMLKKFSTPQLSR